MSLRQEIEALRKGELTLTGLYDDYNLAISDVLKILDEVMQEKDMPDEEGWWLFWDNEDVQWYPIYIHDIGRHTNSDRWIKAIMPQEAMSRIEKILTCSGRIYDKYSVFLKREEDSKTLHNRITFSHIYPKLHNQNQAELLAVKCLEAKDVQANKELLEYDTRYNDTIWLYAYYPLPKTGKLIQLIFLGNKGIPFCTIRSRFRYNRETKKQEDKSIYYNDKIGEYFDIVIKSEGRE